MAAAYTVTLSRKPPVALSLQSPTKKSNNSTPSKSLLNLHKRNPNLSTLSSSLLCIHRNNTNNLSINPKVSTFANIFFPNHPFSSVLDSFLVFITSLALFFSVFITDVDSASAFVVTSPRRLQEDELATVRLFQENTPSVVYITNLAVRQDAYTLDVLEVPQGSGSGFVWDKDGRIVTNYHVIRGASDLRVTLSDQSTYEAKVVGFDQDKDVALLRIDAPKDKLKPVPVGASANLLVGQKVYAIGNPFGLDHTLTTGVISAGGAYFEVPFAPELGDPVDSVSGYIKENPIVLFV